MRMSSAIDRFMARSRLVVTERQITLLRLLPVAQRTRWWVRALIGIADRVLGVIRLNAVYEQCRSYDGTPETFVSRAIQALRLDVRVEGGPVPSAGGLLVVGNHPQGGPEALALLRHLLSVRSDVKILANGMLGLFDELQPLLIRVNPLRFEPANVIALRNCSRHLEHGGALVVFPAGRVSSWESAEGRITDGPWGELVGQLLLRSQAALLPVFSDGCSSRLFINAGRLWATAKLLLLPRELLTARGRSMVLQLGTVVRSAQIKHLDARQITRFARVLVYNLEHGSVTSPYPAVGLVRPPLASSAPQRMIRLEVDELPHHQLLASQQNFRVLYARRSQCPLVVRQIAIERERTFRQVEEGSGKSMDTDDFDNSYVHLFVFDDERNAIVGAYRIGHSDELVRDGGLDAIYLSRIFEFDKTFFTEDPKLELGRSFVVPEYQKRFYPLLILWQGIGRYLQLHPRYSRLYGTVSLSRLYDPRSVRMVCDLLISEHTAVRPRYPLLQSLAPEWEGVRTEFPHPDLRDIELLFRAAGKADASVPVLLRQYFNIGARFISVGIDVNFCNTPGLLLQLDTSQVSGRTAQAILHGKRKRRSEVAVRA